MSDYDAAQFKHDSEKAEEARQEEIRQDWLGALKCPGARRIFGRMIYNAATARSFCQGDSQATAFNEGTRAVGLAIMQEIEQVIVGESTVLLAETIQEINHGRRKLESESGR